MESQIWPGISGVPGSVNSLPVDSTTTRGLGRTWTARRPADAGEFLRAVNHVREGLAESSGLTGVMGAGVQGLGEAPWLDPDAPAATDGRWTRQFNGGGHQDSGHLWGA